MEDRPAGLGTYEEFIHGLHRIHMEDLRHKYGLPRDLNIHEACRILEIIVTNPRSSAGR